MPLSTAYAKNNAAGNRPGFDRYNILFADNVTCAIEVKAESDGTLEVTAELNDNTSPLNGTEFLAFYAVRGIGG